MKATYSSKNDMERAVNDKSHTLKGIPQGYFTTEEVALQELEMMSLAPTPVNSKIYVKRECDTTRVPVLRWLDPVSNEWIVQWIKFDVEWIA